MASFLALLLAGCGGGSGAPPAAPAELLLEVGDLARIEQAVAEHRGHALLLNFWATWCPPCVAELPDLVSATEELAPRGARVLGVSYDLMMPDVTPSQAEALVRDFLARRELALPTLIFDGPDYDEINARFDLPGAIPVTLAFDRNGVLVDREEGEATRERFAEMLAKALGR